MPSSLWFGRPAPPVSLSHFVIYRYLLNNIPPPLSRATEGAIETWTWTVQLPPPESLPSDWDDSPAIAAARERLEAQKKVTAKVRKMVSSCPAFKELRLVKSAQSKLAAQIEKLEAKAARLRQRIASIEPSGWKEFVRVVQVRWQCHVALSLFLFSVIFGWLGNSVCSRAKWQDGIGGVRALCQAEAGERRASRTCRRASRAENVIFVFCLFLVCPLFVQVFDP